MPWTMRYEGFKSEQRFCFACKEQSLRQIAIVAGSIGSSGISAGDYDSHWNPWTEPAAYEAGDICDNVILNTTFAARYDTLFYAKVILKKITCKKIIPKKSLLQKQMN